MAGTISPLLLIGACVAAILCAPLLIGRSLRQLGLGLLGLSFVAVSWNAIYIDGFQLAALILVSAFGLLLIDSLNTGRPVRLPAPILIGAVLIALSGFLSEIQPQSLNYMNSRDTPISPGSFLQTLGGQGGNLTQLAKFEVALVLLPLAVALGKPTLREARSLGDCWALSAVISGIVAITDDRGITAISPKLLGVNYQLVGTDFRFARQSGLTSQPNHLAIIVALVIPVVLSWFLRGARWRVAGCAAIAVLAEAVYLAGSRGGLVGAAIAALLFVLVERRLRRKILGFALVALLTIAAAGQSVSELISGIVAADKGGGEESNIARAALRASALRDFHKDPVHGVGFTVLASGHQVELELLAAGGMIALLGYLVYQAGVLVQVRAAVLAAPELARAMTVAVIAMLAIGIVENQVADIYLFVPAAILIASAFHGRTWEFTEAEQVRGGPSIDPRAQSDVLVPSGST